MDRPYLFLVDNLTSNFGSLSAPHYLLGTFTSSESGVQGFVINSTHEPSHDAKSRIGQENGEVQQSGWSGYVHKLGVLELRICYKLERQPQDLQIFW